MSNSTTCTRKLDYTKLKFATEPMPTRDALADITPMEWGDDVLRSERQVSMVTPLQS